MADLRRIDIKAFGGRFSGSTAPDSGPAPDLRWIAIVALRIDPSYQRHVLRTGEKNILAIARGFEWAKFAPVIVAPIEGGLFAIIDGQHRATAAALCGKKEVPCQVVIADRRKQAEAFAAVNGNVTAMSSLQLHAARVAAGEPKALALAEACAEADVSICRYPIPGNKMKPGETLAVGVMAGLLEKFGREIFVAALSCITKTRKGNPGMIRAQIVDALCAVLEAEPAWFADTKRLIIAMQTFDFAAEFNAARAKSVTEGDTIGAVLVESIYAHLDDKLAVSAA
jgi:hypothetical protein